MLDSFMDGLVPIFGVLLLFGGIPGIILTGVIMYLKNRRHKVEEQSKLISQMIEKSEGANIDFKAMAEMLNESDSKKKTTKMAVLKHLEYGALCSLVGLFVLLYGLFINPIDKAVIIGGLLLTIGVAFLIMSPTAPKRPPNHPDLSSFLWNSLKQPSPG